MSIQHFSAPSLAIAPMPRNAPPQRADQRAEPHRRCPPSRVEWRDGRPRTGHDLRSLQDRPTSRRGRDGCRLSRARHPARSAHRPQGAAGRRLGRSVPPRPAGGGGARRRLDLASLDRHRVRGGRGLGAGLHRHGVRRRLQPAGDPGRTGGARNPRPAARSGRPMRAAGGRGARRRPRSRVRAPRRETGQSRGHARGPAQGARLRAGGTAAARRGFPHAAGRLARRNPRRPDAGRRGPSARRHPGHPGLHVTRADARRAARPAFRCLLARLVDARDAVRKASLHAGHQGCDDARGAHRARSPARRTGGSRRRARTGHRARALQGAARPVRRRRGDGRGSAPSAAAGPRSRRAPGRGLAASRHRRVGVRRAAGDRRRRVPHRTRRAGRRRFSHR